MLSGCRLFLRSSLLPWLVLPVLLVWGSCSKPPSPVVGHSTALRVDLPDYDPFTAAYPLAESPQSISQRSSESDRFFSGKITPLHISISAAEWESLVQDFTTSENTGGIKRQAHLAVGDTLIRDVGISIMGQGSAKAPQLDDNVQRSNFRIDFGATFGSGRLPARPENEGRRFFDMPALVLTSNDRDRTYLRPHLVSEMMREFGVPTPRIGFVSLHLEIEDRQPVYLGVYALHEVIEEQWFDEMLGEVTCIFAVGKGDLSYGYLDQEEKSEGKDRSKWCDRGLIGEAIVDPDDSRWRGKPYRPTYAFKGGSEDCASCQEYLNELIVALNGEQLAVEDLSDLVDDQMLLRSLVVSAFTANVDDFWIYGNNGFLCRVKQAGQWRWTMVPIDFDLTFNRELETLRNPTGSILRYGLGSTLGGQMLAHEEYRSQYRDLVLAWYMNMKQKTATMRTEKALAPIQQYLRGYAAKDPNSFSRGAVLELIRFCTGKMKMIEKELGL